MEQRTQHDDDRPEQIIELDEPTLGLAGTLVIDSTVLGPAFGGIRRLRYAGRTQARDDARRLARAMRDKCALAGLPAGGAKTALVDDGGPSSRWPAIYEALGRAIETLGGRYVCGPDVGTGDEQLAWVRRATRHCNPAPNDASAATAAGVLAAMRAVWRALELEVDRATVVVQGLGGVGGRLAAALAQQGARVLAADPDPEACARARTHGVAIVELDAIASIPCDVFAPCALGHVVDVEAAARWPCRAICGAANNALQAGAAAILHRRGIVVVPDIVASAGAVIEGVLTVREGDSPATRERIAHTIAAIETTAAEVLAAARATDRPTAVIATERARAHLDSARPARA